ncbi:MAG: amidohydrolase family protein [Pirellulaceae bacterium]
MGTKLMHAAKCFRIANQMGRIASSVFGVAMVCICAGAAFSATLPQQETGAEKKAEKSKTKTEESASKDEKDGEQTKNAVSDVLAIVGADIQTVTKGKIRKGILLIKDGKIAAAGQRVEIPEGAKEIDATGKTITPGFVAINMSRVGLRTSSDRNAKYEDGLDPFDRNVTLSLGVGITTGCIQIQTGGGRRGRRAFDPLESTRSQADEFPFTRRFPGLDPDESELEKYKAADERNFGEFISTCPCCGLPILPTEPITPTRPSPITPQKNAVIKMAYGVLDGMFVGQNVFLDVTPGALSGATNQRNWREQFEKARKYLKDQAAHEKATASGKKEKPPRKPVSDEILRLVQGEIALRVTSFAVADMMDAVELSKELDFKLVLTGAYEAWVIAKELAEADASVSITPRNRRDPTFGAEDRTGTWIETSRVLEEAGVPFAVQTLSPSISLNGLAGRDLTSLPLEAAFAVRGGASERKALEAITIVPARMMGLDDRIGSIEVGKDADLLILNGSPLDYRTYVETAIVNGNVAYERKEAAVLPVFDR